MAALEADRALVRRRGARVCAALAADDVDAVRAFVDTLGRLLRDDDPGVVQAAAAALTEVATADPDAATPVLDDATALADSTLGGVQIAGAQLLGAVAKRRPDRCTPVVAALLDRLVRPPDHTESQSVAARVEDSVTQRTIQHYEQEERERERVARQVFANVVVAVAEADPSALAGHVETVAEVATAEDPVVRGAALDILAAVARESPRAVDPVAETVIACLDADERVLRARAVQTLGHLGDERYADALDEIAETDDDEIAALAAETAAFLDT
ncbi:HEAT repeat domain-containing protein [Halomicroarcula sp. GCM10025709]|uniref:HEAT repeat domain-containing protein n=1 Tax=Halomicroarcula sp. GCM10025709 TaxID=3252669 RepID=UPI00362416D1